MTADLKLGLMLGYWTKGPDDATAAVLAAEDVGCASVWTAEAYGSIEDAHGHLAPAGELARAAGQHQARAGLDGGAGGLQPVA